VIKLSQQKDKGYKKSVGFYQKGGQRKQKMWWLGNDLQKAEVLALRIQSEWKQIKASGGEVWTKRATDKIDALKASLYKSTSTQQYQDEIFPSAESPLTEDKKSPQEPLTFYQAIDYFCQNVIPPMAVTDQWKRDLAYRMEHLKDAMDDIALVEIGSERLDALINFYKNRPKNKKYNRLISPDFVKTEIRTAKRLFEWLDETGRWMICRGFVSKFKKTNIRVKLNRTERLKATNGNPVFSTKELVELYRRANSRVREYMTLSLNCGFTQKEISSLMIGECHIDCDAPYIERMREKTGDTGVIGKWRLWDETVELLKFYIYPKILWEYKLEDGIVYFKYFTASKWRKYDRQYEGLYEELMQYKFERDNKKVKATDAIYGGLVYLNDDDARIDAVASAWWRLLQKCPGVSQYSFKSLRKTGADMVKKITGLEEVAMCYLCQSPRTVSGQSYTNPDYERLGNALINLRDQLQPMFDAPH